MTETLNERLMLQHEKNLATLVKCEKQIKVNKRFMRWVPGAKLILQAPTNHLIDVAVRLAASDLELQTEITKRDLWTAPREGDVANAVVPNGDSVTSKPVIFRNGQWEDYFE